MSILIPYTAADVVEYLADLFNLDLSNLTDYETLITTILSNMYFFIFWFIIVYFSLKIFNRIWERFF